MNWQTITVGQYQQVFRIMQDTAFDEFEKEVQIAALLSGHTEREVEALTLEEYKLLKQRVGFAFESIPAMPQRMKKWKQYAFIYDIRKLTAGRYISIQHFINGADKKPEILVNNLHHLAACLVDPEGGYRAEDHEQYAADMLECPFVALYHSMVFFCNLYNLSIRTLLPYLEAEAKAKGATKEQIAAALTPLSKGLAGY